LFFNIMTEANSLLWKSNNTILGENVCRGSVHSLLIYSYEIVLFYSYAVSSNISS
jgi:hypothetical protein